MGGKNYSPGLPYNETGNNQVGNNNQRYKYQPEGTQNFGGGEGGGKKSTPAPPDYYGAAQATADQSKQAVNQQTQSNRPNQNTPWASNQWTQGPDGQWQQNVGFSGPMAGISSNLQNQAASATAQPLDFSSLGKLGTGDDARDQAITGAYNQAKSRLDPQWQMQDEQLKTQLANEGLDPNSAAGRAAMQQESMARNDAYGSAMNSAIGQGTAAQQATFGENLASRQQGMNEMLTQRQLPLSQLQGLQGFLAMPGFNAANAYQPANYLGAAGMAGGYGLDANKQWNENMGDMFGGMGGFMKAGVMSSDERIKSHVKRLPVEAAPGIPLATFKYKHAPEAGHHLGVIAQDVEKVKPHAVHVGHDGIKKVDYSQLKPFGVK